MAIPARQEGRLRQRLRRIEARDDTRAQLVEQYAPLVKYVVDRLRLSLPPSVERDDLIGYGTIGLLEALDRFDDTRGVKFETYAAMRIRGAILDALRTLDIVPRSARSRARQIEQATREFFAEYGRMPSENELADHLGMTTTELQQAISDAACLFLPLQASEDPDTLTLEEQLADPNALEPGEVAAEEDLKQRIAAALARLSERDRLIVSLYYYEDLTMREISQLLGISESRVSQILNRVRLQLRALLRERGVGLDDLEPGAR
ncbi:FliA/WhiG family RNA polymerase sigma factor [Thermomicrobium sp.]|jgi:RNA polymerase sigma factor for flagellar operon FliA|uniref:FliA/WhiG family RNA polymerase sigma factor n=1 Tax=Thermomicrobium sp. TaxID=1969469 RepID=UPI001B2C9F42|nr:FliA/WhiG family RNA polymerase sigma factor [Thermomicrobium sp.]MBO9306814.1 FliA/WhiG family RNA polymerase sigma factor [Thermomicrobium sp.]MBO9358527.1 FliA/WhiG family RNA polymerase sigma factor [Thermomicrobium sp.]MBO9385076.1 FliA/WhiG family RNA polymerase sigma factor [Thermomicrobium sp.]